MIIDMKKKMTKRNETKKSSLMKAISAQGMPGDNASADYGDNAAGDEDSFFANAPEKPKKKRRRKKKMDPTV